MSNWIISYETGDQKLTIEVNTPPELFARTVEGVVLFAYEIPEEQAWTSIAFGEDGVTRLYGPDGEVEMEGDYYHDKISDRIEGFMLGLRKAGVKTSYRSLYCDCEELPANFEEALKLWEDENVSD